jgi:hypothetical protein
MDADAELSAELLKEVMAKNGMANSTPGDGPMVSGKRAHEHPARLPDLCIERDRLSLSGQGERIERRDRGLVGSPDHRLLCWGFGLCFLRLRNVKGFGWNHNRVYRI